MTTTMTKPDVTDLKPIYDRASTAIHAGRLDELISILDDFQQNFEDISITVFEAQFKHAAAKVVGPNMVAPFLERGMPIALLGHDGLGAMNEAQSASMVRYLHAQGAAVDHKNSDDETPLHGIASKKYLQNRLELAQTFIELGADVNARCKLGETPILAMTTSAIKFSNNFKSSEVVVEFIEMLTLLTRYGADCNARDTSGANAVGMLCKHLRNSNPASCYPLLPALLDCGAFSHLDLQSGQVKVIMSSAMIHDDMALFKKMLDLEGAPGQGWVRDKKKLGRSEALMRETARNKRPTFMLELANRGWTLDEEGLQWIERADPVCAMVVRSAMASRVAKSMLCEISTEMDLQTPATPQARASAAYAHTSAPSSRPKP